MNCLSQVTSYTVAIWRTTGRSVVATSSLKRRFDFYSGIKLINLESVLTRFHIQLYSSRRKAVSSTTTSPRSRKKPEPQPAMEPEKDAFFVVRKGDVVGVYKNFNDCQAQLGSSICDPPVSVYKGEAMPKKSEEYLVSRGLKNAIYTIRAADMKEDLFGKLVLCPVEDPTSSNGETSVKDASRKRPRNLCGSETEASCILQFDGASKGNPGLAGAGAVLRADDGSLICKIREGLGIATNNVAEYRAVILGLKCALRKGFTKIVVQGDSKLVCMQVQGLWKVKNENMSYLYEEVKKLKDKFLSFKISHVLREGNSEADAQANLAITLSDGQVQEESGK